jgi:hypothetical protein
VRTGLWSRFWTEFQTQIREDWSGILISLTSLFCGVSVFFDPPSSVADRATPLLVLIWTIFIISGASIRIIGRFFPMAIRLFCRNIGSIAISVGLIVYDVATLMNPNASWFVFALGIAPFIISIDRIRHDNRIAKANEELRELAERLEKRTYYVDE